MDTLVGDCLNELVKLLTPMGRYMLSSSCKDFSCYNPPLSLEDFVLEMLKEGCVKFYAHYWPKLKVIIDYHLEKSELLAYLGMHVSFTAKKWLATKLSPIQMKIIAEFGIFNCSNEELQWYRECLGEHWILNTRDVNISNQAVVMPWCKNEAGAEWSCRHGVIPLFANYACLRDSYPLKALREAIRFYQNNFYMKQIHLLKYMPIREVDPKHMAIAIECGNSEVVRLLLSIGWKMDEVKLSLHSLSTEIIDLVLAHRHKDTWITWGDYEAPFKLWSQEKVNALVRLFTNDVELPRALTIAIYGDFGGLLNKDYANRVSLRGIIRDMNK